VDTAFLQMFDFPLLKGDRKTALLKPNSVVLTASTARKLFGSEDPMGKTITHFANDTVLFRVTGVAADAPENSQLQFDALGSFNTFIKPDWSKMWGGNWLNTYFELAPNTDVAAMEKQFPAYLKRHLDGDGWKYYELFLLPLQAVHAHAADIGLDYINYQKFDSNYTNIFTVIALIVLIIACVNFMNLSTARSAERAREVGIRKSMGALRSQLSVQFLSETVLRWCWPCSFSGRRYRTSTTSASVISRSSSTGTGGYRLSCLPGRSSSASCRGFTRRPTCPPPSR
jgi:putative ABC transport system permease protein